MLVGTLHHETLRATAPASPTAGVDPRILEALQGALDRSYADMDDDTHSRNASDDEARRKTKTRGGTVEFHPLHDAAMDAYFRR